MLNVIFVVIFSKQHFFLNSKFSRGGNWSRKSHRLILRPSHQCSHSTRGLQLCQQRRKGAKWKAHTPFDKQPCGLKQRSYNLFYELFCSSNSEIYLEFWTVLQFFFGNTNISMRSIISWQVKTKNSTRVSNVCPFWVAHFPTLSLKMIGVDLYLSLSHISLPTLLWGSSFNLEWICISGSGFVYMGVDLYIWGLDLYIW